MVVDISDLHKHKQNKIHASTTLQLVTQPEPEPEPVPPRNTYSFPTFAAETSWLIKFSA
jgi:hypothetical protein